MSQKIQEIFISLHLSIMRVRVGSVVGWGSEPSFQTHQQLLFNQQYTHMFSLLIFWAQCNRVFVEFSVTISCCFPTCVKCTPCTCQDLKVSGSEPRPTTDVLEFAPFSRFQVMNIMWIKQPIMSVLNRNTLLIVYY